MLTRGLYSTFLLLFVLWGQNEGQGEEPAWLFSLTTPDNVVLAIGHAPPYLDESRGYAEARLSGSLKLAYQIVVHIESKSIGVAASEFARAVNYLETLTDNDIWDQVQQSYTAIDSAVTPDGSYVLMAISRDPGNSTVDIDLLKTHLNQNPEKGKKTPEWVANMFADKSRAVGFAIGEGNIGDNEYVAMKDAIVNIAAARSSVMRSFVDLFVNDGGSVTKVAIEIITKETVHNARVLKRWYDRDNKLYYSLVSTE